MHGAALKVAGTLPRKEDPSILEGVYNIIYIYILFFFDTVLTSIGISL